MSAARVSTKGWVVIPKDLRKKYGLTPGSVVEVVDYGGILAIVPVPENPIAAMHGRFAQVPDRRLTEELIEEHRREREERSFGG